MALKLVERKVDLGTNGAEWKHGYIPLNAAAVAIKEHRKPGSAGKPIPSLAKAPGVKKTTAKKTVTTKSPAGLLADSRKVKLTTIDGKDHRNMTPAQKVAAVKFMHGDGSKQHLLAAKHYAKPAKATAPTKAKPYKILGPEGTYNAKADVAADYPGLSDLPGRVDKQYTDADYAKATKDAAGKTDAQLAKDFNSKDKLVKRAARFETTKRSIGESGANKVEKARAVATKRMATKSRKSASEKKVDDKVNKLALTSAPKIGTHHSANTPAPKTAKPGLTTSTENKALYKLTNQDLEHEISVAKQRGNTDRAHTLQIELVQRKAKIKEIFGQSVKAKDFVHSELPKVQTPAQMGKFLRGLTKIMPSLKPRLDKIAATKVSKKLRDVKYFDAIVESAFQTISDHIVGGLVSAASAGIGISIFGAGRG